MPICPKCGRLIAAKKFSRHVNRCGQHHKKPARPLSAGENILERL